MRRNLLEPRPKMLAARTLEDFECFGYPGLYGAGRSVGLRRAEIEPFEVGKGSLDQR